VGSRVGQGPPGSAIERRREVAEVTGAGGHAMLAGASGWTPNRVRFVRMPW
jgi:hypothetical protein